MTKRRFRGWKAMLAMAVGGGAVAWHIMACVESPMSFSPNGDLAFTVMDPYDGDLDDNPIAGEAVYRLMILSKDGELREIERTASHLLSGPAYSPDGTRFAYLRIPLLTKDDEARIANFLRKRYESYSQARNDRANENKWIFVAPENYVSRPPHDPMKGMSDLTLPYKLSDGPPDNFDLGGGIVPLELVVREAATGEIVKSVPVDLPAGVEAPSHNWTYLLSHPQFTPDGGRVHFWSNLYSLSVNLADGKKNFLAPPGFSSLMSPDGQTIATLYFENEVLGLSRTDGTRTTHIRLEDKPSLSGLAWAGDDALLVLGTGRQGDTTPLDIYNSDGYLVRSLDLPIDGDSEVQTGELALSPGGKYVVVSFGKDVYWLDFGGKVLGSWKSTAEGGLLVQPIFTPDSSQVAFKLVVKEKTDGKTAWIGTTAIVFFTPEGRELFRVPVPRAGTAETAEPQQPQTTEQ